MSEPKQLSKEELKTVMQLREDRQGAFDDYSKLSKIVKPTKAQERLMRSLKGTLIDLDARLEEITGVSQNWTKLTPNP